MARLTQLATHRSWEDWAFLVLGIAVILSPLAVIGAVPGPVMVSVLASGIVILGITLFEFMDRLRFEEFIHLLAGIWLVISPYVLDFGAATQLRGAAFVLGALTAILALFEIWQDSSKPSTA